MEYKTCKLAEGHWLGQLVSKIVSGSSKEEVIRKLDLLEMGKEVDDLCATCDPFEMPLCNKCGV